MTSDQITRWASISGALARLTNGQNSGTAPQSPYAASP